MRLEAEARVARDDVSDDERSDDDGAVASASGEASASARHARRACRWASTRWRLTGGQAGGWAVR